MTVDEAYQLAVQHSAAGRFDEAAQICEQILQLLPEQPDVLHLLGTGAFQTGRKAEALALFQRSLARNPGSTPTRNNLACTLVELGRPAEALAEWDALLRMEPGDAELYNNVGDALFRLGRVEEAVTACRTAVNLQPTLASAHNNLGNALRGLRQHNAAIEAYVEALRLQPGYAEAQNNLGACLTEIGRDEEAVTALQTVLQWQPHYASARNNLGCALLRLGRIDESVAHHRLAVESAPLDPLLHSNLIYTLQFSPHANAREIAAEQVEWNRRHAHPLAAAIVPCKNAPQPDRPLKIGYVSPDLREHPIAFFLSGALASRDRAAYETHCYSSVSRPDAVTAHLQGLSDHWHEVRSLSHEELATKVRSDGIDILVDLSMHSADNRLPLFARKPAPVQVSWLAYPGTTGVQTIDYRLTDAVLEPSVKRTNGPSERPVFLPDSWCCYTPIGPAPEVGALPALRTGTFTFGSFSKPARLPDALLHCWAQLAARVPSARWLLLSPPGPGRTRILDAFGPRADRVTFVAHGSWVEYLRRFAEIDLCLDTHPNNGLTATCHALWMGTPVVSLAGHEPAERAGASIITAAGLPQFIARTEAEYLEIAARWAADPAGLARLREALRPQMRASALMDQDRFGTALGRAYREMWVRWCRSQGAPLMHP